MQTSYRTLMTCGLLAASGPLFAQAAEEPWANDPAVQAVLEQRRQSIEVMTSTGPSAASERYSPTFVANTPAGGVVTGETMLQIFASGTIRYDAVEQQIDYAGSHGPDMVVLMGEETSFRDQGLIAANACAGVSRTCSGGSTGSGGTTCATRT